MDEAVNAPRAGSLFSGIGGLDLGLHNAGWQHAFFCESEPYRRAVLEHRFPGVPVYQDVREVAESPRPGRLRTMGGSGTDRDADGERRDSADSADLELLCGGFPCQDLSVAGQRKGLAGERSGLFYEFARVADTLRPRFLLIENVPGLLSSHGGRDFGELLGTLADIGYGVGWRILDSRYFGVPQRRRRVFIVGVLADGDTARAAQRAGEILAVGQSCDRHSQTGAEKGPDAAVSSALGTTRGGGHGLNAEKAAGGQLIPVPGIDYCGPIQGRIGKGRGWTASAEEAAEGNLIAPVSRTLTAKRGDRYDAETETFVTAFNVMPEHGQGADLRAVETDQAMALSALNGQGHDRVTLVAGVDVVHDPECDMGADCTCQPEPQTFDWQMDGGNDKSWGGKARSWIHDKPGRARALSTTKTLALYQPNADVRRLTPVECERLQALPDGWTDIGGTPDSPRYAALGDAVTASVGEWIGRRILERA